MKKLLTILYFLVASLGMTACAQAPRDVNFSVMVNPYFEDKFFPCLAIWNSVQDDPTDIFYSFLVHYPVDGAVVRITLEETALNEETIIQTVISSDELDEDDDTIITPIIKWKYDKFNEISQGGVATMTCILEIDGKEIDRINNTIRYRPINECIFGFYDEDGEWNNWREMFALYVNEDYPAIDDILQEILAQDRNRSFVDYQGSAQDFLNQVVWVWEYFSKKGTRYSNIVNTSHESENIGTQYVRFIDQVLNNVQANCVDGSALLASIYRKIGLDANLVLIPGHCMLAIGYPGDIDMGSFGRTGDEGGVLLIETTLMGANTDHISSFDQAVQVLPYSELERRVNEEEYMVVNIAEARAEGILPIKR